MKIDFEYEISEMTPDLQLAEGYLECEKVIVNNLRKHIIKGFDDKTIVNYLEKLSAYFKDRIRHHKTPVIVLITGSGRIINTLIKMRYWRSWIKTIDM